METAESQTTSMRHCQLCSAARCHGAQLVSGIIRSRVLSGFLPAGPCLASTARTLSHLHASASTSAPVAASAARSFGYIRAAAVAPSVACQSSSSVSSTGYSLHATSKDIAAAKGKLRLDAFIGSQVEGISRVKAQAVVKAGLVLVNGSVAIKPGATLRAGDLVVVAHIPAPPPLQAVPENIPLDVVYEDEHLIVINKPAGMVVHISAGHHSGTLVNALLHHCGLPGVSLEQVPSGSQQQEVQADQQNQGQGQRQVLAQGAGTDPAAEQGQQLGPGQQRPSPADAEDSELLDEGEGDGDGEAMVLLPGSLPQGQAQAGVLRPGIVHRLDKGTSGLLVVAKQELSHRRLCDQFKARTVGREYLSVTLGCPQHKSGRVETNIDRDPYDRKRMAALALGATRGRNAASNYWVEEVLADGGAALVRWKLETGRTHQIRVHAKHLGHPLLGDDTYGGAAAASATAVARGRPSKQPTVRDLVATLARPALHARTLAFDHPVTGGRLSFAAELPPDFQAVLQGLRGL